MSIEEERQIARLEDSVDWAHHKAVDAFASIHRTAGEAMEAIDKRADQVGRVGDLPVNQRTNAFDFKNFNEIDQMSFAMLAFATALEDVIERLAEVDDGLDESLKRGGPIWLKK